MENYALEHQLRTSIAEHKALLASLQQDLELERQKVQK